MTLGRERFWSVEQYEDEQDQVKPQFSLSVKLLNESNYILMKKLYYNDLHTKLFCK